MRQYTKKYKLNLSKRNILQYIHAKGDVSCNEVIDFFRVSSDFDFVAQWVLDELVDYGYLNKSNKTYSLTSVGRSEVFRGW